MKAPPNRNRHPNLNLPPDNLSQFNSDTVALAQLQLIEILKRFDSRKLSKQIEKEPELAFPLINAFCNFSRLQLAREKFVWQKKQAEARQRAREEKQRARHSIVITAETIRALRNLIILHPESKPIELDSRSQPCSPADVPPVEPADTPRAASDPVHEATADHVSPSARFSWLHDATRKSSVRNADTPVSDSAELTSSVSRKPGKVARLRARKPQVHLAERRSNASCSGAPLAA
jgi:hypothetical protein